MAEAVEDVAAEDSTTLSNRHVTHVSHFAALTGCLLILAQLGTYADLLLLRNGCLHLHTSKGRVRAGQVAANVLMLPIVLFLLISQPTRAV